MSSEFFLCVTGGQVSVMMTGDREGVWDVDLVSILCSPARLLLVSRQVLTVRTFDVWTENSFEGL